MVILTILLMTVLAWRLGAFDEWKSGRQLDAFDRTVLLDMDEADWEDRQEHFRKRHPRIGHRRAHMSLGRRR